VTLVEALDWEWHELVSSQRAAVTRWGDRHVAFALCRSLDDILSAVKLNSDPILGALLTEVSTGDRLAGRVVLQALIGRMVRMAQRDPRASVDDYLAALWGVINSYPLSRRPVRIAANLSLDTLKAVSSEHRWLRRGDVTLWPSGESLEELLEPVGLDGSAYDSLPPVDVEVARVLEAGGLLSLIDDSEAELLHSIYADGISGDRAARRFRLSEGTVRVRCSKAVRRLAAHAVELAVATA
jgi:DNA-directed RNA polymerase specialized sigma24 family protein